MNRRQFRHSEERIKRLSLHMGMLIDILFGDDVKDIVVNKDKSKVNDVSKRMSDPIYRCKYKYKLCKGDRERAYARACVGIIKYYELYHESI